jgi:glycosyltransferase involved in cell wall biosynthesis
MSEFERHKLKPLKLQSAGTVSLKPRLSVICITYNHGKYLRECLDGILAQETAFDVEIIVHDDASADNSQEIIREYEKNHPEVFKTILQTTNQLGVIGGRIVLNAFSKASGDFIAYCDGDDRWTDPLKLQHQVDFLDANQDCSGCFHATRLIDNAGEVLRQDYYLPSLEKHDTSECISLLASAYSTSSLVFRREALESPPEWLCKNLTDLFLEFQISRFGKVAFMNRNMSDYRSHGGGIWSGRSMTNRLVELIHRYKTLLEEPEFAEKHAEVIKARIDEYSAMLICKNDSGLSTEQRAKAADYEIISRSKWVRLGQALGICHRP